LESEFNAAVEELVLEGYDFEEERWEVVEAWGGGVVVLAQVSKH
jgi:hypothetical protein